MIRRVYRVIVVTLCVALTIYGGILSYLYLSQESQVFFPQSGGRALQSSPADVGLAFEDVYLSTSANDRVHGWFIAHSEPRGTILYFHGNAGNIGHRVSAIQRWHRLKFSILIIDYPGYGQSDGRASEDGCYAAARAAWKYLRTIRGMAASDITIFGRSLGGGVAAQLASEVDANALILDSTFSSVPDMAAEIYPWLPIQQLMTVRFETKNKLPGIRYPVMIMHSRDDSVIPFSHAKVNFDLVTSPKQFLELQGNHNSAPAASEPAYSDGLDRFLSEIR